MSSPESLRRSGRRRATSKVAVNSPLPTNERCDSGPAWKADELTAFFTECRKRGGASPTIWPRDVIGSFTGRTPGMLLALYRSYSERCTQRSVTQTVALILQEQEESEQLEQGDRLDRDQQAAAMTLVSAAQDRRAISPLKRTYQDSDDEDDDAAAAAAAHTAAAAAAARGGGGGGGGGDDDDDVDDDDDDAYTLDESLRSKGPSARSRSRSRSPSKRAKVFDAEAVQACSVRILNFLKLRQSVSFCAHEWFYSSIDQPLFRAEVSEYQDCLNRFGFDRICRATRTEWTYMRNRIGKPRRLSHAFLASERAKLDEQRTKVRVIQQGKMTHGDTMPRVEIPQAIPRPIVVGHRVTALFHGGRDGGLMYMGNVLVADVMASTYKVQFDRRELGINTLPDTQVMPVGQQKLTPVAVLTRRNVPSNSVASAAAAAVGAAAGSSVHSVGSAAVAGGGVGAGAYATSPLLHHQQHPYAYSPQQLHQRAHAHQQQHPYAPQQQQYASGPSSATRRSFQHLTAAASLDTMQSPMTMTQEIFSAVQGTSTPAAAAAAAAIQSGPVPPGSASTNANAAGYYPHHLTTPQQHGAQSYSNPHQPPHHRTPFPTTPHRPFNNPGSTGILASSSSAIGTPGAALYPYYTGTPTRKKMHLMLGDLMLPHMELDFDQPEMLIGADSPYMLSDLELLARLTKILNMKEALVDQLSYMNDQGEQMLALEEFANGLPEDFKQHYAWTIVQLDQTNHALKPLVVRLEQRTRLPSEQPLQPGVPPPPTFAYNGVRTEVVKQCDVRALALVRKVLGQISATSPVTTPPPTTTTTTATITAAPASPSSHKSAPVPQSSPSTRANKAAAASAAAAAAATTVSALEVLSTSAVAVANGTMTQEPARELTSLESLVVSLISLLLQVRECAERKLNAADVRRTFNDALKRCNTHEQNKDAIDELSLTLQSMVACISASGSLQP